MLAYLPADTPLDSTVHITIDAFNNAFAHAGGMGVSLLKGAADRRTFEVAIAHELHHLGVGYWAARDAGRRALLAEKSGRSVAVLHVGNLLSEGLANYYLSPGYVFPASSDDPPAGVPAPVQRGRTGHGRVRVRRRACRALWTALGHGRRIAGRQRLAPRVADAILA